MTIEIELIPCVPYHKMHAIKHYCALCFHRIEIRGMQICEVKNIDVSNRDPNCPCSYYRGGIE